MHQDELWQEYNQLGEPLSNGGRPIVKGNPKDGEDSIVGIVIVIVIRKTEHGLELLWQERGPDVDNAGKWDLSAGGHINYGETILQAARREAHEEIGLEAADDRLYYAYSIAQNTHRYCWTYIYDHSDLEDNFSFNDREVASVKWVPYVDTPDFLKNYCKEHVAKDTLYFDALEGWLKLHGYC